MPENRLNSTVKLMLVLFVILPFGIISNGILHQSHKYGMVIIALALFGSLTPNRWFRYFVWYCALWQIVLCLKWIYAGIPPKQAQISWKFTYFAIIFIGIYLIAAYSRIKKEWFYNAICIAALVHFVIAIFQLFDWDPVMVTLQAIYRGDVRFDLKPIFFLGYQMKSLTGILANNNFLACFLVVALPFFVRPRWWPVGILIAIMVLRLFTVTATFAAFVGGIYYFRKDIMAKKWLLVVLLAITAFIVVTKQSLTIHLFSSPMPDRFEWWLWVWNNMQTRWEYMVFGLGQGAIWLYNYPIHNEFVEFFYNFGIVGMLFLVPFLLSVPRRNKRLYTAFIIFSITCMGTYPMHLAQHTFMIAMILGLLEREKLTCQSSPTP